MKRESFVAEASSKHDGGIGLPEQPVAAAVNEIGAADVRWALAQGRADFRELRGDLLFLPFIYAAVGFLASALAFNRDLFVLIFPLAGGFALIGPLAAAGFYELSRRRDAGEPTSWWNFFRPMQGRARGPLVVMGGIMVALFVVWILTAQAIYLNTMATIGPHTPEQFMRALFSTREGWTMILLGNAAGAAFAVIALAIGAFSIPMVVDKGTDPASAILTSLSAFRRNPKSMLVWGAIVAGLLVLGSIPFFLGLMIVLPVLGYASWHLYTRAVAR